MNFNSSGKAYYRPALIAEHARMSIAMLRNVLTALEELVDSKTHDLSMLLDVDSALNNMYNVYLGLEPFDFEDLKRNFDAIKELKESASEGAKDNDESKSES